MKLIQIYKKSLLCVAVMVAFLMPSSLQANATTLPSDSTSEESTETTKKDPVVKNGWNDSKTKFFVDDKPVTGVYKIDGKLYLFRENGKLYKMRGLQKIDGSYYYFAKNHSLKTGVVKVEGKYYFFLKKNGKRYEQTGIRKVNKKYYYFKDNHSLKSGWVRNSKNARYYFDKKTFAAKTGWEYVGQYKYYFKKNGQLSQDVRKKLTKEQKKSYYIKVNRTACCVTVYAKDGKKGYTIPVVSFICSTGAATPVGTHRVRDKLRWHELMGPCWGQWCEHLTPTILFHSVPYNKPYDKRSLSVTSYNKLGTMASHGCIRLTAGDAKWIYDNCAVGTKVTIYNNEKDPGPFDKPIAQKLRVGHTWDPTDPTIQ